MASGDPRVTAVMITHNRRDEVLRSLGKLDEIPEKPRIILVDNASTDGTCQAVARQFPGVKPPLFRHQSRSSRPKLGRARGPNAVCRTVRRRHLVAAGLLMRAADLLDAYPRVGVLTARLLNEPEEIEDTICQTLAASPLPGAGRCRVSSLLGFLAGARVVRRTAFLEAGGFDPRFFIGGEEQLLAIELAVRGWTLCYVPQLVVRHHPSPRATASGGTCRCAEPPVGHLAPPAGDAPRGRYAVGPALDAPRLVGGPRGARRTGRLALDLASRQWSPPSLNNNFACSTDKPFRASQRLLSRVEGEDGGGRLTGPAVSATQVGRAASTWFAITSASDAWLPRRPCRWRSGRSRRPWHRARRPRWRSPSALPARCRRNSESADVVEVAVGSSCGAGTLALASFAFTAAASLVSVDDVDDRQGVVRQPQIRRRRRRGSRTAGRSRWSGVAERRAKRRNLRTERG